MDDASEPEFLVEREVVHTVVLEDPDPLWPEQYAAEELLVRGALEDVLVEVHHVGSTSVPGLPAKPIVDILLVVEDTTDEAAYVPALESAGYTFHHREPDWHQHRLLKKGLPHFAEDRPGGLPRFNLHVFPAGCEEVTRMLAFRDRLRADEADRRLYAETKRRLARERWERVQDYADAKTDVVDEIMERALQASKGDGSPAPTRTTSG